MVGGVVSRVREIQTKNGDSMGFVSLSYYGMLYEVVVWPKMWNKQTFRKGRVLVVEGRRQVDRGGSIAATGYAVLHYNNGSIEVAEE